MTFFIPQQEGSILNASWPAEGDVDELLLQSSQYLMNSTHEFRIRIKNMLTAKSKKVGRQVGHSIDRACRVKLTIPKLKTAKIITLCKNTSPAVISAVVFVIIG